MKTLRIYLVLFCVLTSVVLTGCRSCQLTCCRHHACNPFNAAVTHVDHGIYEQP
jgi:hypothetical protein